MDDALAAFEEGELLRELGQFVGGASAIALRLGALDVRIVELALEPASRLRSAPARRLDPCMSACRPSAHSNFPVISRRNPPSRMPRSAMRSRSEGQRSRIVS